MSSQKTCNHCGQKIKQAYKEMLSKHKLTMLQTVARQVVATGVNDFNLRNMNDSTTNYINFQKLRYHGVVHHVRNADKSLKRGHWFITPLGWSFLRGERDLPKFVLVRENSIVDRSPELINVKDVYRGSEAIITTFEYFDEYGKMVGVRPTPRTDNQMGLFA